MSVKVGDKVYLWCHAYLRLIGRVRAVLGSRRVSLEDASVIYGDEGYQQLLGRGVKRGTTNSAYVGVVADTVYLAAFDFPHDLPGPKE